ncbi:cupin domain-containing protein [Gimesia aquarii]|uniref:Cupin domain protein n=1 Tax=Gimesia aquarii TaxID=2527964 RepID=A0A517VUE7_9PLAN|nr:cupin domain-containing protein [Gimesia aquarii]QDT96628.1 Cupin domain protein [Gimesia aquarii]
MNYRFIPLVALIVVVGSLATVAQNTTNSKQQTKAAQVKKILVRDLDETFDGKPARATMHEITWEPGASTPAHRHPCPTFVYVLEGELETQVGDGPLLHLKAGNTLYEPTMTLHSKTRNPSKTHRARILAIQIHDRAIKRLTIPEK